MSARHACPCCGHRTLASRGDYEVCPVCAWEDDGEPPWTIVTPNGCSLVEAQLAYLAEGRVRRWVRERRNRWRRPPRPEERRDPDWRPLADPEQLLARVAEEWRRERERQRELEVLNADLPDPLDDFNDAVARLAEVAAGLPYAEVEERYRELSTEHGFRFPPAELELLAHELQEEHWRRRHPLQVAGWCWRHRHTASRRTRLRQALTGRFRFVG